MTPVTDPAILEQLNAGLKPVTDPAILAQLNAGGVDTAADSAARGLPPNPAANTLQPVEGTGYFAKPGTVAAPSSVPDQTLAQIGKGFGDIGIGTAEGVPSGILGTPGDIEGIGRAVLSKGLPVSKAPFLPTSAGIANSLFGEPSSPQIAAGRLAGNLISPSIAMKGLSLAGKVAGPVAAHTLGLTTGAGGAAVGEAFKAGSAGGDASKAFLDQMRGNAPVADVVQTAKGAVAQMRADKNAAYKAGIGSTIKGDPQVLDFAPIDKAVSDVSNVGSFQGKSLSSGADKVRQAIQDTVDDWKNSDPNTFHTPEGLDALKQKIGNLGYEESLKTVAGPGTPGKVILDAAYNAVKNQIVKQAPGYADVMKDYMNASDELRNIEGSFSLGRNASTDTSLRKLQSIMRNNANTNYGQRVQMGNTLADNGADNLVPALAGQAMSAALPRGLSSIGDMSAVGGAALAGHPGALALAPLGSPRIVGELAHALGRVLPNANKGALAGAGNAGIASMADFRLDPKLLAGISPQILAQLLTQTQAPIH